ncbi:MAG: PadR family transcriptional regulator [Actinobacteria bacterium ATB1]|nr:PadR family transcriptional regulator [Actinobacteria bacterium ATB1]
MRPQHHKSGRPGPRGRRRHSHGRAPRCRRLVEPGVWEVQARVERFVEPALLLLLAEGPRHGYELADLLGELSPGDQPDMGNLYRLLRGLEEEGVVISEWGTDGPGPARRTYRLTEAGRSLLDTWAEALDETRTLIDRFLRTWRDRTGRDD